MQCNNRLPVKFEFECILDTHDVPLMFHPHKSNINISGIEVRVSWEFYSSKRVALEEELQQVSEEYVKIKSAQANITRLVDEAIIDGAVLGALEVKKSTIDGTEKSLRNKFTKLHELIRDEIHIIERQFNQENP